MGSTLGRKRKILNDTLWVDPIEICAGRLTCSRYRWRRNTATRRAAISYLKIKLTLEAAGFDATFHPSTGGKAPIP